MNCKSESRKREHSRSIIQFGKMLHRQGFVAGTDGNISVRLDHCSILTTPTKISKGRMKPDDLVVVDLSGKKLEGRRAPSSEIDLHLAIYREREDINAVVHAHPCTATAFACAGFSLEEPLCSEILVTLGGVPLAPYRTPGTPALAEAMRPFILDHDAILMANHGVVTYGPDLSCAYLNMEIVEHFARIMLAATQLGHRQLLDTEAVRELSQKRKQYRHAIQ